MANRMILNETSYFGAGSISEIVTEAKKRAFKKALVVTDPDLIKFNVAQCNVYIISYYKNVCQYNK